MKLRLCMGQNAGYFNKANRRYPFLFSFKKVASKIEKIRNVKLFFVV